MLEDLPKEIQGKVDGNSDICSDEIIHAPRAEDEEPIEEDNDREKDQGGPCGIWLEMRSEY